ncbi:MAG: pyruvate dehydrogenase kinase [Sumerlaeia bacterium]
MIAELPERLANDIRIYARRNETPLTLKQLFDFGRDRSEDTLIHGSQYLHVELPIRVAKRVVELENMPHGLSMMPAVRQVWQMYVDTFRDIRDAVHPHNMQEEQEFITLLDSIKTRHNPVFQLMARGVKELKTHLGDRELDIDVHTSLDRFYISRIGIRMLIGQHVAIHEAHQPGWVGIICGDCSPAHVARDAAEHASHLCQVHYGDVPKVRIVGQTDVKFTYIPTHLYRMLFELLKNSLRATVETHGHRDTMPEVKVIIADGKEDITIKISDEGGGIPRSGLGRLFTYLYTTAKLPDENPSPYAPEIDPMAGYGFGLAISRLYARYFGGDLQIISMEGYGTDAYLHLSRLGDQLETLA